MTKISDVLKRRAAEQSRIRKQLNSMRAEEEALLKGGDCLLYTSDAADE